MLRRDVFLGLLDEALDVGADAEEEVTVLLGGGLVKVLGVWEEGVEGGEEAEGVGLSLVDGG